MLTIAGDRVVDLPKRGTDIGLERGLRHAFLLEIQLVEESVSVKRLPIVDRRLGPTLEKGHAQPGNGRDSLQMERSREPTDGRAPIVAEPDRLIFSEGVDEPHDIVRQGDHVVRFDGMRLVAFSIAPDVRHHDFEARLGDGPDLVAPRVPELGKPVHHDHKRSGALDDGTD